MKTITYLSLLFVTGAIFLVSCSTPKSGTAKTGNISGILDEQEYTFVAQTAFPTEDARYNVRNLFPNGSNLYQLTSRYDVKVTPDTVEVFLPFFGRSFTAPLDPSKGGIKFTSTDFNYKKSQRKNNYEIEITPRDNNEIRTMYLTVSPNGYASLRINSNNKTPIAFNGIVEENQR